MSERRFLASTIDWLVCALVPFVVVGALWFAVVPLIVVAYFACSDAPAGGYSTADLVAFALSGLVAVAALLARLWLFVDAERRTVLDRLFGLAVVSRTGRRAGSRLPAG